MNCPKCNSPLTKEGNGKLYCPVCGKRYALKQKSAPQAKSEPFALLTVHSEQSSTQNELPPIREEIPPILNCLFCGCELKQMTDSIMYCPACKKTYPIAPNETANVQEETEEDDWDYPGEFTFELPPEISSKSEYTTNEDFKFELPPEVKMENKPENSSAVHVEKYFSPQQNTGKEKSEQTPPTKKTVSTLPRLNVQEDEIATMKERIAALEARIAALEAKQTNGNKI